MTPTPPAPATQPRRARHLMDPNAPRRVRDPHAEARLARVQQWVLSSLAVTTILHMSVGLIVGAMFLDEQDLTGRVGLSVIAGGFGVMSVAVGLAIHRRSMRSPWLLLGALPLLAGLWLTVF